jgi:hypothetical protein
MEKDIIWYPPENLRWTFPNDTFRPEKFIPYGKRQCEIINEARERLLDVLRKENPMVDVEVESKKVEVVMDPAWSHASETHYTPMFLVQAESRIRYFQVAMNRSGPTEVDTQNPIGIREVTNEIRQSAN